MFCGSCGTELATGGTQCPHCGRRFDTDAAGPPPAGGLRGSLARPGPVPPSRPPTPRADRPPPDPPGDSRAYHPPRTTKPSGRPVLPGLDDLTLIGSGSFSTVFRAKQAAFDRVVAVKVLHTNLSDAESLEAFEDECAAAGRLSEHPNIVNLYGSGLSLDHRPYIVMAHYSGGSLAGRLETSGPLGLAEVLRLGVKMASALEAAHQADVLHRDVKPGNIMMSGFGEPVLGDFGIASLRLDRPARQLLTPNFSAPEALWGGPATAATDLYSLAATLYTLLVGVPPFALQSGETTESLAARVQAGPLPMVAHPEVDPETEAAILWGLAADPAYRAPSAVDLGRALQAQQRRLGLPITELADGSSFRHRGPGGFVTRGRPSALPPPPTPTGPVPAERPASVAPSQRLSAAVVDLAFPMIVAAGGIALFRDGLGDGGPIDVTGAAIATAAAVFTYHLVFTLVVSSTPGRAWMAARLAREDGQVAPWWAALVRPLVALPSIALLGAGYFAILLGRHRTWPDLASKTTVVSCPPGAGAPRSWFAAGGLIVAIAIVAIVAAVALL